MDISFYTSPLIAPALGVCLAASIILFRSHKHSGAVLMMVGFALTLVTHISIKYCTGLAVLTNRLSDYPILCSPIMPHLKGFGFVCIGLGIFMIATKLKRN